MTRSQSEKTLGQWRTLFEQALPSNDPLRFALRKCAPACYLNEVGLGFSADRPTRSLSGGETERENLTTCLGTRLVNTLYVLDEPSVGLHARNTDRLVRILRELRDIGNTVVVVEHEPAVMRAADHIVDLGPGHGESGGEVVYAGAFEGVLRDERSPRIFRRRRIESRLPRAMDARTPSFASRTSMQSLNLALYSAEPICLSYRREWFGQDDAGARHSVSTAAGKIRHCVHSAASNGREP
jgi:ABC-type multidrug transport system ATPase subunit